MAKSLRVKNRKRRRDKATAYASTVKSGKGPKRHKVAVERSTKAKKKLAYRG